MNVARILLTRAPHYFLPFWYSKVPMFWLPRDLFPYYAEWLIAMPKAPLGSVSILSWQIACTAVIKLLSETVLAAYALATAPKPAAPNPVPQQGRKPAAAGRTQETEKEKKEL